MRTQLGKNFITIALTMVITLGGLSFLWGQSRQSGEVAVSHAQVVDPAQPSSNDAAQSEQQTETERLSSFEEAYRAGYRDGRSDCTASHTAVRTSNVRRVARRSGVAGDRYYAQRKSGSSTKDLILTIAAPAAIGAGIGAIAGGKKGAGIGALLGGGGGAAYYLIKNRRKR